ncbi:hypothetical protein RvY_00147-2 [Ramazzottius varieornatus]|uniref:Uncharacterized protein n=1 Tax=Ramazzottius varieornatus TaxID=947166 RepID=A0A1D1UM99_RAMVA|nr:hypothetical protein RvY_00147-2 [Ramazzottius varieornatus]
MSISAMGVVQGWVFGAARVNGKINIGQIHRQGLNMLAVIKQGQQPDTGIWTATTVRNRRYESYMCYQKIEGRKTGGCQPLYPSRFHPVAYTTLRDMRMLIASSIDAADSTIDELKHYPQKYVDLVTVQADDLKNPTEQYRSSVTPV